MIFTTDQILAIQDVIRLHHNAYIANTIGKEALPKEAVEELRLKGLLKDKPLKLVKEAYIYGHLLSKLGEQAKGMSYAEFQRYIAKDPIPLSNFEQRAVVMAQLQAGQYCKGLGNKISTDTGKLLIDADNELRIQFEDTIKTATARSIATRSAIDKIRSDIGWATGDWARDLRRIAITEKTFAMQQGQADQIKKEFGKDALVARIPQPDACKHCRRLHLGSDGQPIIFKLSELEKNGTNVGRKANDWVSVIGPIHPHCQCQLIYIPKGWGFNAEGELVPGGKLGEKSFEKEIKKSMETYPPLDFITFQGLRIAIETKEGTERHWKNSNGETGTTLMMGASYGFIQGSSGLDGEEVDCFVGTDENAENVYIIDQKDPNTGLYDEQKCMIGFDNERSAINVYRANYDYLDGYLCNVQGLALDAFKRWLGFMKKSSIEGVQVADRSPGPGLGINYFIPIPKKKKKKKEANSPDKKDLLPKTDTRIDGFSASKYVNKEAYKIADNFTKLNAIGMPESAKEANEDARKQIPTNLQTLDRYATQYYGAPNKAKI